MVVGGFGIDVFALVGCARPAVEGSVAAQSSQL
jgi:hypothetical protein